MATYFNDRAHVFPVHLECPMPNTLRVYECHLDVT